MYLCRSLMFCSTLEPYFILSNFLSLCSSGWRSCTPSTTWSLRFFGCSHPAAGAFSKSSLFSLFSTRQKHAVEITATIWMKMKTVVNLAHLVQIIIITKVIITTITIITILIFVTTWRRSSCHRSPVEVKRLNPPAIPMLWNLERGIINFQQNLCESQSSGIWKEEL